MSEGGHLSVRFWGVRGSIACPGPAYVRYGGNTSCVEVRCGPHLLIFDGGTGLRPLGEALKAGGPVEADLFFSHSHLDHVVGVPFFHTLFEPENRIRLWAGHLKPERGVRDVICALMTAPLFPVPVEIFSARTEFLDFAAGETLTPKPGVVLRTIALNHPNGSTGYRVDYAGKSVCYVTDTEHEPGRPDARIVDFIRGTDLFIYDATYTDEEYPRYATWGHSTWEEGVRLAKAARVKTLALFHHDPSHDDGAMDRIAAAAAAALPGAIAASEGLTIEL